MDFISGLVTPFIAGLVKILLEFLYGKAVDEIRASLKEKNAAADDLAVHEAAIAKLMTDIGFDPAGKTQKEVDEKSEQVFDDFFNRTKR